MIYVATLVAFYENLLKVIKTVWKVKNILKSWRLSFIGDILLSLDIIADTKATSDSINNLQKI